MNVGWAFLLVILAVLATGLLPLWGLWRFNEKHARGLKHIELLDQIGPVQISEIRLVHPEILKVERLDRHPSYVARSAVFLAFGIVVMFVSVPYSNLGATALNTQYALGVSLLFAAALTLVGSALGLHFLGQCVGGPRICNNVVSSRLGDDIRLSYVLGWWGQVSAMIGMGFYVYTVIAAAGFERIWSTYGGIVSLVNIPLCGVMVVKFILRLRRYIRERDDLIAEGLAIMAAEDAE